VRPAIVFEIVSAIASLPRAGMWVALIPAARLNFSIPRWVPVPMPVEPNRSCPGFACAAAISALTVAREVVSPATST
jgi:hypothetical protein